MNYTKKEIRLGLTFDDVLLEPMKSSIIPSQANIQTNLTKRIKLDIPIISAAMDTVTESDMAIAVGKLGGLGVLHRNCEIEEQLEMVENVKKEKFTYSGKKLLIGAAVGPHDIKRAKILSKAGVDIIFIDCAHAHNIQVIEDAKKIKKIIGKAELIVGNIATAQAAKDLINFVDGIKVGIGPGSICTTRLVAGIGVPQLTAIMDVVKIAKTKNVPVIADGGIRYSGDIVKSLAAGAQAVMLGSLLAGTEEAPGKRIKIQDKDYKVYRGMGSLGAMNKNKSADRYFQEGAKKYVPEGIKGILPYKGKVGEVIYQLVGGLKAGMGYIGAKNISQMPKQAHFIQITSAGRAESQPHTVIFKS